MKSFSIDNFRKSILKNYPILKKETLSQLDECFRESILKPVLFRRLMRDIPIEFDYEYSKFLIESTFESEESLICEQRGIFIKILNRIDFHVDQTTPFYLEFRKLLDEAIILFNNSYKKDFQTLVDFKCFDEEIVEEKNVEKFYNKYYGHKYNVKGWINFYESLLSTFYPDYIFNKKLSSHKYKHYEKKISDNLSLVIVADIGELKYQANRGWTPSIDFVMKLVEKNDHFEGIWNLNWNLKNPFFFLLSEVNGICPDLSLLVRFQ